MSERMLDEQGNRVSLREYLEHKICALDKRIDERLCSRDNALALQAKEYERRLGDLNHEQARLLADRERFLPRETYEAHRKDLDDWRTTVNKNFATSTGRVTTLVTVAVVLSAISAALITAFFKT